MLTKLLAKQQSNPFGIFTRLVLAPLWNKRNSVLNDAVFDRLILRPDDRVLEVGFGGGYLLGRMAAVVTDGFLAGVDISPAMVVSCEDRFRPLVKAGKLELKCATAEALPYPSAYFNKVCTVNSIFYWENAPQAISELGRVLGENGLLVLCFTCKECMEGRAIGRHVKLYEAEQVQRMMESAGFHEIAMTRASDKHRAFWCATGKK